MCWRVASSGERELERKITEAEISLGLEMQMYQQLPPFSRNGTISHSTPPINPKMRSGRLLDPIYGFCWAAKYFWDLLAMMAVMIMLAGSVKRAIRVIVTLMESIIKKIPNTITIEVITWVRLCWRVVDMISMSFVTRLRISP